MAAQPVSDSPLNRQASVCVSTQQGRKALRQAFVPEPNIRPEGRHGPVPQAHGGDGLINREEGTQRAPVVLAHAAIHGGDAHMLSSPARPGWRRSLVDCVVNSIEFEVTKVNSNLVQQGTTIILYWARLRYKSEVEIIELREIKEWVKLQWNYRHRAIKSCKPPLANIFTSPLTQQQKK